MVPTPYLIKNGLIVNEGTTGRADLILTDGRIEKIFRGGCPDTLNEERFRVVDMEGLVVFPGVIDDQVHFREPGLTTKGDIGTESAAAVAGGITSFMEMPNTLPQCTTQQLLEDKFQLAREKSVANFSFYIGATNDNLHELKASNPLRVCGVKVFMGSSTGNMLVDDPIALEAIFRDISLPIAVHCEDETTIRANAARAQKRFGNNIPPFMHAFIRSHEACMRSSRLAVRLAEKYGTRLHLLHLSTAGEMRFLRNDQPLKSKQITAEACIHHLWFHVDDYAKHGMHIKWNPSVKFLSDQKALIEGIRQGYVDVVATDHAPHTLEEKARDYSGAPSGGPMVQHALPAMLTLAEKHRISYERIAELMCHHPAICFSVKQRGFIREGYHADLVAVDPKKKQTVARDNLLYKCGWSPLEGAVLTATVEYTFVNGNIVYSNGKVAGDHRGQELEFER